MKQRHYKNLIWISGTLLITSFLFPLNALSAESIGHVIQSVGTVTATNNGKVRILKRGSRIKQGDVLKSERASLAQLRMNDNALVALRQNTEFRFDEYQYAEDKKTGSSIFSLIKGGFRTITGLIGKRNRQNYRVNTSVATIGVRGTHYGLTLCSQGDCTGPDGNIEDGLYGSVVDGEITTKNEAGLFVFSNDEYFHVASATGTPKHLIKPPGVIFGQDKPDRKLKKMKDDKRQLATMLQKRTQQQATVLHAVIDQKQELLRNPIEQPMIQAGGDLNSTIDSVSSFRNNVLAYSFFGLPGSPSPVVNQVMIDDGTNANQFELNAVAAGYGEFRLLKAVDTFGPIVPQTRVLEKAVDAPVADVGSAIMPDGTQLGWGRWAKGAYGDTVNGSNEKSISDLHYAVASALTTPTQIGSLVGIFNYTTAGGTRATDLNGNIATNVANVNMSVNFTNQRIDTFSVGTNVGGNAYVAKLAAPMPAFTLAPVNNIALSLTTACPGCSGVATIGFVGKKAEGAFTTYNIVNGNTNNAVNGAAILKQPGTAIF